VRIETSVFRQVRPLFGVLTKEFFAATVKGWLGVFAEIGCVLVLHVGLDLIDIGRVVGWLPLAFI
jgi:hypothetical protein